MPTLFKILGPDRQPVHGGWGQWPEPGAWLEVGGPIVPCKRGLHLCEVRDLVRWLQLNAVVWEVEADGESVRHEDSKTVVRRARLVREVGTLHHRLLVAWAADCAERVLPVFEAGRPDDSRPRDALSAVWRWLSGDATIDDVKATAHAAYVVYADAAAATAHAVYADAAAAAAYAAYAAAYAAASAAYAADAAAAAHAAYGKRREERGWQGARLLAYLRGEIAIPTKGGG